MSKRAASPPSIGERPQGWFHVLKVGHDPRDPAEATLVLAAAAAANGLSCTGEPMEGGDYGHAPSQYAISRQLCLGIDAVRRGVKHLVAIGAVHLDGGVHVHAEAMQSRWANHRQRLHISTEARLLRMRPRSLLLTALVEGQVDQRGQLRLGIAFLMERTGFPERTLKRALATANQRGAIHTWVAPPKWQLFLAPGPSRNGTRRASQGGTRSGRAGDREGAHEGSRTSGHREEAPTPSRRGTDPRRKEAPTPSQRGTRPPDASGVPPDSPPDAPASPAGETKAAPAAADPEPDKPQPTPSGAGGIKAIVDAWVLDLAKTWWFDIRDDSHVSKVAILIDSISPRPQVIHDHGAFFRDRLDLARSVIRWCPSPERLGRWLIRVHRWFRVENLGAYLRRACAKGDPGTVLESHTKNLFGRAAEHWRDFTPETERALEGPCVVEVAQIVDSLALAVGETDEIKRTQLRDELRKYWSQHRPVAARTVLRKLVGGDRSDVAIERAAEGILTLHEAKALLEAA